MLSDDAILIPYPKIYLLSPMAHVLSCGRGYVAPIGVVDLGDGELARRRAGQARKRA